MIPKIIHYCWLSDDPMPKESIGYVDSWHQLLPDYKFVLWNRDNFDIDSIPWVREAFDNKKYAFAADYIRLFAVYNYGGFYLDSDIELKKTFDGLLNNKIVIGYESPQEKALEAGCFGAEQGNQFIGNCLSYYENRHFMNDDGTFNTKPLPLIMSAFITPDMKEKVFSCDFFTAKNQETGVIEESSNTYAVHHFAGSWLNNFERGVLTLTSRIHKILGRNLFSKIVFIAGIFVLRVKTFGMMKSLSYYRRQYFTANKNTLKPIFSFFRNK